MLKTLLRVLSVLLGLIVLAFLIARTPDIPRDELRSRYASDASQFLELPSGAVAHVRDQGPRDAPVLALIHGSNSSLHTWEPWVELLGDELRIVSVDLPGHGLTGPVPGDDYSTDGMACFLDDVRRELGIERWSLAGNSMGGGVVIASALEHPNLVDALILVDSGGVRPPPQPGDEEGERGGALAFRLARTPGVNLLLEQITPRGLLESTLQRSFGDQALVDEPMVDRYFDLLRHPGNRRATRLRMTGGSGRRGDRAVEQLTIPTLVMSGEDDRIIPAAVSVELDRRIPNSQLLLYPGVGHIPMEEIPQRSAADVRSFLERASVFAPVDASDSSEG